MFFAYIGFDAISTAAEETKNPQRNLPIGILGGLAICTRHLRHRRRGADRAWCRTRSWRSPTRWRARSSSPASTPSAGSSRSARSVSMSAVLLVFQYGQPRIFFAMARDGLLPQWAAQHPSEARRCRTSRRSSPASFVALWSLVGDAAETYDLTNIGTLFAFMLVSIGVLVLRYKEPDRPRPFRVPFVWPVVPAVGAPAACSSCRACPTHAWERFGIWLVDRARALFRLRLSPQPAASDAHSLRTWPRRGPAGPFGCVAAAC